MSKWIRRIHRWLSITFTLTILAYFVALGVRKGATPPPYIVYAPLIPLFLLLFTGLYLFVLPYVARRKGEARE